MEVVQGGSCTGAGEDTTKQEREDQRTAEGHSRQSLEAAYRGSRNRDGRVLPNLEPWRYPDHCHRRHGIDHHTGVSGRADRDRATPAGCHTETVRPGNGKPGAAVVEERQEQPPKDILAGVLGVGGAPAHIAEEHSWGDNLRSTEGRVRAAEPVFGHDLGSDDDLGGASAEEAAGTRLRGAGRPGRL